MTFVNEAVWDRIARVAVGVVLLAVGFGVATIIVRLGNGRDASS